MNLETLSAIAQIQAWWSLRRGMFAAGFRDYIEATKPAVEAIPLTELIRGKS